GGQVRAGLESLPQVAIAALAICLSFSEASLKGLYLGQLGVFTAVMLLLALGAWVAYVALGNRLPRPAVACLVSLSSLLFIYHRDYDTLILALPLVYCAGRLGEATGRARWAYAAIGVSTIGVLYMSSTFLRCLTGLTLQWGAWGRLVQGTVLPYATWLILLSMLTLFCVEARANAGSAS